MSKPKYTQQLTKALEAFMDASDKVANVALNFELTEKDAKYAQELTRSRTQELKKQLDHKPVKVSVVLPSEAEDKRTGSFSSASSDSELGG